MVSFELADRPGRLAGVRLVQEIGLPGSLEFVRTRGAWRLEVDLPDVRRMEYLLEIRDRHGDRITVPDPANPRRAPGAFGEKSVLEVDAYRAPTWLTAPAVAADEVALHFEAPELDGTIEVTLWAPDEMPGDERTPLLVVHDGPEYACFALFTRYLASAIGAGDLPPLRAALIGPGDRNVWYSANPAYADALTQRVLPALHEALPTSARIGIGASLGALAMLHAHRNVPGVLDGLFLQSGSFFTPRLDPQESAFSGFDAVTEFVATVHAAETDTDPVPTVITCGTVEENLANNQLMAQTLQRLGYAAEMTTVEDAHNYTAWRDALHPHLTKLITEVSHAA